MKKIIVMIGLSLSLVACGVVSAAGSVVGGTVKAGWLCYRCCYKDNW